MTTTVRHIPWASTPACARDLHLHTKVVVCLLMVMRAIAAGAHVGDEAYPVYKVPPGAIDLHDGSLDDWEDITPGVSIPVFAFVDVFRGLEFRPLDLEDLTFRVFLGWSEEEQRIYGGVEAFDDMFAICGHAETGGGC